MHEPVDLVAIGRTLHANLEPDPVTAIVGLRSPAPGRSEPNVVVMVSPGEGANLLDGLVGFTPPSDWHALGIVAHGRASSTGGHDVPRRSDHGSVTVAHLVGHDGAWAVVVGSGETTTEIAGDAARPPEGMVADACHRAFGLATAPCPATVGELWAAIWLDRLLRRVAGGPPAPTLADIVAAHPAAELGLLADGSESAGPDRLVAAGALLSDARPWPTLRVATASGAGLSDHTGITPAVASWMDDAMFARWSLAAFPDLDDLVGAFDDLAPRHLSHTVRWILAAWDLLGCAGAP